MGAGAKKAIWKPVRFQSIRINMSCCQYARNTDAARPRTGLEHSEDNIDTPGRSQLSELSGNKQSRSRHKGCEAEDYFYIDATRFSS